MAEETVDVAGEEEIAKRGAHSEMSRFEVITVERVRIVGTIS